MIEVFKKIFFLLRLHRALELDSMIKDHRDVMMLEATAKELGIDPEIVGTFTLNEPWVLLSAIRNELIQQAHECQSFMEGIDFLIPRSFEERLRRLDYSEMRDYCPDVNFNHAGFIKMLTPQEVSEELISSGTLEKLLGDFRLNLDALEEQLKKNYDRDIRLAEECNRDMLLIFAIFEHIESKGLELFTPGDSEYDIWYKKFTVYTTSAEAVLDSKLLDDPSSMNKEEREAVNSAMEELGVDGMEQFWSEVDQQASLHLLKFTGNEDFKSDVKRMAGKAAEMLTTALKSLKTRFDERKKEGSKEAEGIKEAIDKAISDLSNKAGEPDANLVKQLQQRLTKAGFEKQASKLNGVTTYTQLGQAFSTISGEFTSMISEMKEAEAKLREAEAKVKEASTPPSGTSEDADETTKAQIKAQMSEAQKTAKELMKSASTSIGESMKSIAMLRGIKSTLERITESTKEKVDGQESWML
ncbi:hypothetical protein FDJ25_gp114 [Vibrio phage Aphrodite1]|uniref:Uncharacterized protein n=1 Tax=Vibrio phage Aphrodite1 TaxID=2070057 RepID=A0A2I7QHS8_9CAUD|nr:hypothetical protein FDJ25_gp114 [Vibrio phage Aphrodite1]AUR80953.1 hypothetical protein Aphrodite1_0089 [Vibrio phage Aphrodite1]